MAYQSGTTTITSENSVIVTLPFLATYIKVTYGAHVILFPYNGDYQRYTRDGEIKYFPNEGGYVRDTGFKFWTNGTVGQTANWEASSTMSVTGVSLNNTTLSLTHGSTYTLVATVTPPDATDKTVSWSSSNPAVATVSGGGLVTALGVGAATITVTTVDGGKTATCSVNVSPIPVTGISVSPTSATLNPGQTQTIVATVTPANATNKNVTWSSSNAGVASVDGNGLVAAVGIGSATITATTADGGKKATCSITVAPVLVTGVSVTPATVSLNIGQTQGLNATVTPPNATNKAVSWSSDNPGVATVDGNGVITAISQGSANITVTTAVGGKTAVCSVSVFAVAVTGVMLDKSAIILTNENPTAQLTATITPANATNKTVSWISSDPTVASVDNTGLVTAIRTGVAVITVITADGGIIASCDVTVKIVTWRPYESDLAKQVEIRVYTPPDGVNGFTPCLITTKAASVRITEHVRKVGSFEIQFPAGEYGAEQFQKFRVVLIDKYFAGIIEDIAYTLDASGEMINIKGKDLKYFLFYHLALPAGYAPPSALAGYDAVTGPTETCIKHFWDYNIASSPFPARRVPGFTILPDFGRGLADDKFKARHQPLSDITSELAEGPKLIIKADLDIQLGKYNFDVVDPVNKTAGQSARPPVVFSIERQNVLGMEYQDITSSGSNLFYATRSGDQYADQALTLMYYRDGEAEPEGIYRHEKHLNVRSDTPTAGQEYAEMRRQVLHEMESFVYTQSFTANVNHARMRYRVDYDLGDIVTVYNRRWGVTLDTQITGVTTTSSEAGTIYSVTFGDNKPNFIQRINREINNR